MQGRVILARFQEFGRTAGVFSSHHLAEEPNQLVLTSVISALCDLKGAWTTALQTLTLSPLPASEIDTSFLSVAGSDNLSIVVCFNYF